MPAKRSRSVSPRRDTQQGRGRSEDRHHRRHHHHHHRSSHRHDDRHHGYRHHSPRRRSPERRDGKRHRSYSDSRDESPALRRGGPNDYTEVKRRAEDKGGTEERRRKEEDDSPAKQVTERKSPPKAVVKKVKKKFTTMNLSFGDEIEDDEGSSFKLKSVEEVTAQRIQEEGRQQVSRQLAALAAPALPRDNGHTRGKAQQVMDDEEDTARETKPAEGEMTIPRAAVSINRGPKAEMEDRHTIIASLHSGVEAFMTTETPVAYYGCFDGHCGALAAEVASSQLHVFLTQEKEVFEEGGRKGITQEHVKQATTVFQRAFRKTEKQVMQALQAEEGKRQDGAAALVAVVARNILYVANAGDCRAVLGSLGDDGMEATRLSVDHKPNLPEERERILKVGGQVEHHGVWRVSHPLLNMRLAVSRSFGDPGFKGQQEGVPPLVSFEPYVGIHELRKGVDLCLILASDGLWDVIMDNEAVKYVDEVIRGSRNGGNDAAPGSKGRSSRPWRPTEKSVREAADFLVSQALSRGTGDNITVIVVVWEQD